jgi:hypothetical protein
MARKYRARVGWRQQQLLAVSPALAAWSGQWVGLTNDNGEPGTFDFYISPTGTGTAAGGGTIGDPWPITMLNDATARGRYAGKRVGLMDGIYRGYGYGSTVYYAPKFDVAGGTEGSPTIIEAVNPRLAIITGRSAGGLLESATATGPLMGCNVSYVQFKNLRFEHHSGTALLMARVYGTTGIHDRFGWIVEGCDFYDIHNLGAAAAGNSSAIKMYQGNQAIVRNCRFERIRESIGTGNFADTFAGSGYQSYDGRSLLVEYCTFIDCKGVYQKSSGQKGSPIVRYCYFDPLKNLASLGNSSSIQIDNTETDTANSITVHNNIFLGRANFQGESNGIWNIPAYFYNNTVFYRVEAWVGATMAHSTNNPQMLHVNRNIFWRTTSIVGGDLELCAGAWNTMDYNSYPSSAFRLITLNVGQSGSAAYQQIFTSLNDWKTHTGKDGNAFQGNPLFVNGAGHTAASFQLQAGSPAIIGAVPGGQIGAWGGPSVPSAIGVNF